MQNCPPVWRMMLESRQGRAYPIDEVEEHPDDPRFFIVTPTPVCCPVGHPLCEPLQDMVQFWIDEGYPTQREEFVTNRYTGRQFYLCVWPDYVVHADDIFDAPLQ